MELSTQALATSSAAGPPRGAGTALGLAWPRVPSGLRSFLGWNPASRPPGSGAVPSPLPGGVQVSRLLAASSEVGEPAGLSRGTSSSSSSSKGRPGGNEEPTTPTKKARRVSGLGSGSASGGNSPNHHDAVQPGQPGVGVGRGATGRFPGSVNGTVINMRSRNEWPAAAAADGREPVPPPPQPQPQPPSAPWHLAMHNWERTLQLLQDDPTPLARALGLSPAAASELQAKARAYLALPLPLRLLLHQSGCLPELSQAQLQQMGRLAPTALQQAIKAILSTPLAAQRQRQQQRTAAQRALLNVADLLADGWLVWDTNQQRYGWDTAAPAATSAYRKLSLSISADLSFDLELEYEDRGCVLQRHPQLGAHDRLLFVRLDDGLSQGRREHLLTHGFALAGRRYQRLVQRDPGGKEEDERLIYVALASASEDDEAQGLQPLPSPSAARQLLADISSLAGTIGKYHSRPALFASTTFPLAISACAIRYEDDVYARRQDGSLALDGQGKPVVMTDGCGLISWDLAAAVPAVRQGRRVGGGGPAGAPIAAVPGGPAAAGGGAAAAAAAANMRASEQGAAAAAAAAAAPGMGFGDAALPWVDGGGPVGSQGAMQVRLYDPRAGCLSKGVLIPDATLPPNTVVVRASMVKAPGEPRLAEVRQRLNAHHEAMRGQVPGAGAEEPVAQLEVVNKWAARGHGGRRDSTSSLSRYLILLLAHCGIPDAYFRQLLQQELSAIAAIPMNWRRALEYAAGRAGPRNEELCRMLLAGIGMDAAKGAFRPDAFLQEQLAKLQASCTEALRALKIPLPGSCMLLGLPDPSGSLPDGCIAATQDGWFDQDRDVLVYRHPGQKPSDVRRMRLVLPPEQLLQHVGRGFTNAVFFSTQGAQPAAAGMAGGDYDGDHYLIIYNPDVVRDFRPAAEPPQAQLQAMSLAETAPPRTPTTVRTDQQPQRTAGTAAAMGTAPAAASRLAEPPLMSFQPRSRGAGQAGDAAALEIEAELTRYYMFCKSMQATMRKAAYLWLAAADEKGPGDATALALVDIYYSALDGVKSAKYRPIPPELASAVRIPDWMSSASWPPDGGSVGGSLLAQLSAMVHEPRALSAAAAANADTAMDPDLVLQGPDMERHIQRWQELQLEWNAFWASAYSAGGSVGSVPSGSTSSGTSSGGSGSEGLERTVSLQQAVDRLKHRLRRELLCGDAAMELMRKPLYYQQASACYQAVYRKAQAEARPNAKPRLTLAWTVAADLLCEMKAHALARAMSDSSDAPPVLSPFVPPSLLRVRGQFVDMDDL